MNSILILFNDIVRLYIWVLIINAAASWLVAFNIINTSNKGIVLWSRESDVIFLSADKKNNNMIINIIINILCSSICKYKYIFIYKNNFI